MESARINEILAERERKAAMFKNVKPLEPKYTGTNAIEVTFTDVSKEVENNRNK